MNEQQATEKLKKKSDRIKALNKKLEKTTAELFKSNKEKRNYRALYNAVLISLPLKRYKITYTVTTYIGEEESSPIQVIVDARSFKEAMIRLKINKEDAYIDIKDIIETAS